MRGWAAPHSNRTRIIKLPRLLTLVLALSATVLGPAQAAGCPGYARLADAYIREKVGSAGFSGAVLIAFEGRPLLRRGYGLANRELGVAATPDSVFAIGSTSKTFTAVAIALLAQDGKLGFDDRLARFIPDAPPAWRDITLAHLLSHESGLAEYSLTTNSFRALMRVQRTPAEVLALVRDRPLDFPPGSRYRYTNTDFAALGMVVEAVSGKPFETFVQDRILRPQGLSHTGFLDAQALLPGRASGYMKDGAGVANLFYIDPSMLFAAGAMYSTVDDLLAWDKALHGAALLRPDLRDRLFADRGHGYGLGFFVDSVEGRRYVGHGGNLPGFASDFERFDDAPLTMILLSNYGGAKVEAMSRDLGALWFKSCRPRP
ncbi:CubicO group peptidase (beta-lactamase class C family) [Caulobacter ginsengisoli]|uniref:CubicO group peptidase (Beta-lactamase class C family) n=1 Tax=Caulobacter ginsengisoli TaxID=400775 RepID=A0ABU0IMR9_9CAUL|nr:serine hydrolase domain-containing protein [Caulobacter ginsengisoli]MDQ0463297.1 CubicO group peptidase (beta-lactamase class C family) [Caulobacter ginsengisoli]